MKDFLLRELKVGQFVLFSGVGTSGFEGVGKVVKINKSRVAVETNKPSFIWDDSIQERRVYPTTVIQKNPVNLCIIDEADYLFYVMKK